MTIRNFNRIKALLFNNVTTKQTIFKNTFWLTLASIVNKILRLVLFIYIARILGATEYGKFTFALAFVGLFGMFADFGLSQIVTREFSQEKEKEKEFPAVFSLKILLTLGALILILIGSFLITVDPLIQKIILILAFCFFSDSFIEIIFAFFRARQKMEYPAAITIFESLITVCAGIFILFYFPSVKNLSYCYLLASLVGLIVALFFLGLKLQRLSLNWDKSIWKKFLMISWPLALIGVLASIYNQTDSIMLGYFKQITENGWYNAAYRIIAATLTPLGLVSVSIFPVLSQSFKESKGKMQKVWNLYMEAIIFLAIPITIGGILLAPGIINFIYGQNYAPAILAFQILMVTSGIIFLYTPFQQVLVVFDRQKKIFWVILFGAIFNIIFNSILIPKFSLYGAAAVTVATHFLVGILLLKLTLNFHFISSFNRRILLSFTIAVLSSLLMYFVISLPAIYNLHIIFSILFGALIYSAAFFVLRYATGKFSIIYEKN